MKKHSIPKQKMSKREKRLENLKRRVTWEFSPVSRVKDSRKTYRRKKVNPRDEE